LTQERDSMNALYNEVSMDVYYTVIVTLAVVISVSAWSGIQNWP